MRIRYTDQELRNLALYIRSRHGLDVIVENKHILEAQKHVLPVERWKPHNYSLAPAIRNLIATLDDGDVNLFESTRSVIEHGVLDQQNGHVKFHPDEAEVLVVQPLPAARAKGEVKITAPSRTPVEPFVAELPENLLSILVELNRMVIRLYETPVSELARSSELDRKRLRNLCVQATNGLSTFEEFL